MEHADKPIHLNALARAKRVHLARAAGPAAAAEVEAVVASEILGRQVVPDTICQRGLRPFEAAEFVASTLGDALTAMALKNGRKQPHAATYSPLHASASTFRSIWKLREIIDELGIPYDFYIASAVDFVGGTARQRAPRPSRLIAPDVIDHVFAAWTSKNASARSNESVGTWDRRTSQ